MGASWGWGGKVVNQTEEKLSNKQTQFLVFFIVIVVVIVLDDNKNKRTTHVNTKKYIRHRHILRIFFNGAQ